MLRWCRGWHYDFSYYYDEVLHGSTYGSHRAHLRRNRIL